MIGAAALAHIGCGGTEAGTIEATPGSVMAAATLDFVTLSPDKARFVSSTSGTPFIPFGVNYDKDIRARLIEEYWVSDFPRVAEDFREIQALGANVVRLHIQLNRFMLSPTQPNTAALDRLQQLVTLCESLGIRLILTGLGSYRPGDQPSWYTAVTTGERWAIQAEFWRSVAARVRTSPAIFAYDLQNEPIVPADAPLSAWTGGEICGLHFAHAVAREPGALGPEQLAQDWVRALSTAIRNVDDRHLITVGLLPPELGSGGFSNAVLAPLVQDGSLDFLSVHVYPEANRLGTAYNAVRWHRSLARPVLVEEIYTLGAAAPEVEQFMLDALPEVAGYVGFYWGDPQTGLAPDVCPDITGTFRERVTGAQYRAWLTLLRRVAPLIKRETPPEADLFQYWNAAQTDHFYTVERNDSLYGALGWQFERRLGGVLRYNPGGAVPLCRYWNPALTDHFYTVACRHAETSLYGYTFERVEGWVYPTTATKRPLYRYWNGNTKDHFYTTARNDAGFGALGYAYEGIEARIDP